jgi:pimeloyl-ACP methyl ester carboxylesterase
LTKATRLALLLILVLVAACSTPGELDEARQADAFANVVEIDGLSTQATLARRQTLRVDCGFRQPLVREVRGTTRRGADYLLYRPRQAWNRDLVLLARGYIPPHEPVGFPEILPESLRSLRDALLCRGFAVAASSYSANGYAVSEGVIDTHLLNPLFWWHFGVPRRTFVAGASLGGLIAVALAESFPARYAGALPMCGPLGGSLYQLGYVGHVRALFDYFYPGALPGDAVTPVNLPFGDPDEPRPPELEDTVVNRVYAAVSADPQGLVKLASLRLPGSEAAAGDPVPLLPADPADTWPLPSLTRSLLGVLRYHSLGLEEAMARGGGSPFDNAGYVYTSFQPELFTENELAQLNAGVDRFVADPLALRYYALFYGPHGNLTIPVLVLHTRLDPEVPFFHEAGYRALVEEAGAAENLMTMPVARYGHCTFTAGEILRAFEGLLAWAESPVRDDAQRVLDPAWD